MSCRNCTNNRCVSLILVVLRPYKSFFVDGARFPRTDSREAERISHRSRAHRSDLHPLTVVGPAVPILKENNYWSSAVALSLVVQARLDRNKFLNNSRPGKSVGPQKVALPYIISAWRWWLELAKLQRLIGVRRESFVFLLLFNFTKELLDFSSCLRNTEVEHLSGKRLWLRVCERCRLAKWPCKWSGTGF